MFSSLPQRGRIALILMVVLSLFVFIMSLGMVVPHTRPFGSLDLNGPVVADSDGHNTVIADTEARRVLVLDERMRLISIISFDVADAPIDAVTDLCVSQGTVYVAGIRYLEGSTDIDKERVISYDVLGAHDTEVFTREGDGANVPSIKSIGDANGDAIITVLDEGLWSNGSPVCTAYLINNNEVTVYGEGELDDLFGPRCGLRSRERLLRDHKPTWHDRRRHVRWR